MSEEYKLGNDGMIDDDVSFHAPSSQRTQRVEEDVQALSQLQAPIFAHKDNPHERLFVACLDGTGNDAIKDPLHRTNVARISEQLRELHGDKADQIKSAYVPGIGTQDSAFPRVLDGVIGYTHEQRVEQAYRDLVMQAKDWLNKDPNAKISLASVGFSRGAEEAASLARLVEERGIQNPDGAKYTRDPAGHITNVQYTKPPLVAPHQVAQAVALIDPVDTGEPSRHDRRLPPSVLSGIQITMADERRYLFKSNRIIGPGMSEDGRFLGLIDDGAHSDGGGGYLRDGLSRHTGNVVVDYLNALSDTPYLAKRMESNDARLNVVHNSDEGMLIYRATPKIDRLQSEGRDELLVPIAQVRGVPDPRSNEPVNAALNAATERHPVAIGPVTPDTACAAPDPKQRALLDANAKVASLLASIRSGSDAQFDAALHDAADCVAARKLLANAIATVDRRASDRLVEPSAAPARQTSQPALER